MTPRPRSPAAVIGPPVGARAPRPPGPALTLPRALLVLALASATPIEAQSAPRPPWPAAPAERCTPASGDAAGAIDRAWRATGLSKLGRAIAHVSATDVKQNAFMSDRPYPPFFSFATTRELWFDPASGVERSTWEMAGLGVPASPPVTTLSTPAATFIVRDTAVQPLPALHAQAVVDRPLDAWAVLHDWRAAGDVRVVARCAYHEYARVVLERRGPFGTERLYLDAKSGLPVKLQREEPNYLWGQQTAEYQYQTWVYGDGAVRPGAVFRLVDGAMEIERIERHFEVIPDSGAPALRAPATDPMPVSLPRFLQPIQPDTERASAHLVLLRNPGYREGLFARGDTVYLLDATQGDGRARLDSAWIARLHPRHRAVVVVVTDLAWPHIAGVRYWVARGATIVSHASSRPMLERVVARRWTREPDALERVRARRGAVPLRFVGVRDSLALAGGALHLYPIDGVASEGALMAWVPDDGVLWASDYVQDVEAPTEYVAEVVRAAARVGITPRTVAAEHQSPVSWSVLERLAQAVPR